MKHATSPPLSENATSAPTFADVARFIAGPEAPTWLVEHFARWSPSLVLDCSVEKMQPTRVVIKERLAEVRDAAPMLQHALRHTPTREFLEIAPSGPIEYRVAFEHMLQDLAGRAERAIASPTLSTADGKTRPGRTKAVPPGASSAKLFCAAQIAEAWAYFHGVDPVPRNQRAAASAHAFWRASGGETKGCGDDPLNGWRYYFKQMQEPFVAALRRECRRHLVEAERSG